MLPAVLGAVTMDALLTVTVTLQAEIVDLGAVTLAAQVGSMMALRQFVSLGAVTMTASPANVMVLT